MKKLIYMAAMGMVMLAAACTSTDNNGTAKHDSTGSHGYSGPADSAAKTGASTGSSAESNGSSDTSKTNKGVDAPVVDTPAKKKP
jgi:hypothetical protein